MSFTIRRTEPSDYEALYEIFSGVSVVWGTLQLPFPSQEIWRKRLAETPDDVFRLVACNDDEVVGQLDIFTHPTHPRRRHVGSLGMAVRDDWQGKGVGTQLMQAAMELADNWLNLSRFELEVYKDNAAAVHLYQNFGFQVEGILVQSAFRDGKYVDVLLMARLKNNPDGGDEDA